MGMEEERLVKEDDPYIQQNLQKRSVVCVGDHMAKNPFSFVLLLNREQVDGINFCPSH